MADQPGRLPSTSVTRPLVGREREQATLHAALAAALAGHGSLVLIGGEAGLGKTTLAEALLTEAQAQGALVLVGRCYDLSETPPYGPWAEALARAPGGDDLPSPPDLAGGGGATSQAALFAAAHAYLGAVGVRQPLVVLLDDLQWADTASLDLLRVLGRQLADVPLLLLVTYRADELTRRHPLSRLLPLLVREARATRVAVRPLREADLRALAGRYALPPADVDRLAAYLHSRAEGNPLFAGELLRTLEEDGALLRRAGDGWALGPIAATGVPPLLRQVIDARVDRLGEAARELLTVAAVVAQAVPLALWQAVAGADEDALLATVERAVGAGLLTEMPGRDSARFAHALVREALYDGLPTARRRALHRRVADTLSAAPEPDPDAVADHLRRAVDPRAAAWLERAGERAQRAYAWRTAAARFTDALGTGDARGAARGWRLVRLARLLRHDDPRRGLAYLDEALHLAPAADDPVLAAAARLQRGLLRCHGGDWRGGLDETAAGAAALDALPAAEVAALRARQGCLGVALDPALRGTLALGLAGVGRYAEARALATRMVAAPPPPAAEGALDDDPHADAWWALGMAHGALGHPAAAQAAFAAAGARYRAMGHH